MRGVRAPEPSGRRVRSTRVRAAGRRVRLTASGLYWPPPLPGGVIGSTPDSGSGSWGSSPCPAVCRRRQRLAAPRSHPTSPRRVRHASRASTRSGPAPAEATPDRRACPRCDDGGARASCRVQRLRATPTGSPGSTAAPGAVELPERGSLANVVAIAARPIAPRTVARARAAAARASPRAQRRASPTVVVGSRSRGLRSMMNATHDPALSPQNARRHRPRRSACVRTRDLVIGARAPLGLARMRCGDPR